VKYVIDSGFCKLKVYNPSIGMDSLLVTPVAQVRSRSRLHSCGDSPIWGGGLRQALGPVASLIHASRFRQTPITKPMSGGHRWTCYLFCIDCSADLCGFGVCPHGADPVALLLLVRRTLISGQGARVERARATATASTPSASTGMSFSRRR
jgi:hypothetical protein